MPVTRRDFLKNTSLATAGTVLGPGLFGNPFVRSAMADTIGDRYLVVLFLDGGNDGLNTIVPADDSAGLRTAYHIARETGGGGLRIAEGNLATPSVVTMDDPNTGTALGFHPAFASNKPGLGGIAEMYDAGNVAVVQGAGYPDYSLSHEASRIIWQTANPTGQAAIAGSGWLGRHLGLEYNPLDIYGVTIDDSIAGELRTGATSVLAINRLRRFGFPLDDYDEGDHSIYTGTYDDLYASAGLNAQPLLGAVGNAGQATKLSTDAYPPLEALYNTDRELFADAYDALGTSLSRDLREVAKIIYGNSSGATNIDARFFQVRNGGYDTHADQGAESGRHFQLLEEVSDAVDLFFKDIADMGVGSKVTLVVWSEFSRRIPQNSNGTDHGSQGPMFVIGEPVTGGVYGNHPEIGSLDNNENTRYSQDPGDGFRSTDFRDVFGTVLQHWVNMDQATILSSVLPLDTETPANDYWTVQNFDMGFL